MCAGDLPGEEPQKTHILVGGVVGGEEVVVEMPLVVEGGRVDMERGEGSCGRFVRLLNAGGVLKSFAVG